MMELGNTRRREEACPKLLNLIPKATEWLPSRDEEEQSSDERRPVELRLGLGPPGHQHDWSPRPNNNSLDDDDRLLSLGYSAPPQTTLKTSSFLHQTTQIANKKKKPTLSPPHDNPSQKRIAQAQVVGWPPIRSSRKNLANNPSSSSKPTAAESSQKIINKLSNNNNNVSNNKKNNNKIINDVDNNVVNNHNDVSNDNKNKRLDVVESCGKRKGMFVKINMDGVPIGRKVDLSAYDNYHNLSYVVDQLFRGLLAAQRDSSEEKAITGLLDGSGEYTLVYEDNEGDRMLVGDVPWNMFVSTVKRLRVLKSSELSALSLISGKQGEMK